MRFKAQELFLVFNELEYVNKRVAAELSLIKWGVMREKKHSFCRVSEVALSLNVNPVEAKKLV